MKVRIICGSRRVLTGIALLTATVLVHSAGASAEWQPAQLPGIAGKSFLLSVSCPSRSLCVASGTNNLIATSTTPMNGASSWNPVFVGEGPWLNSENWPSQEISGLQIENVSCPSTQLCVAAMNKGLIYSATNPTGPASAWKSVEIDDAGGRNTHLKGISCPSVTLCVAVSERRIGGGSGGEIDANLGKILVSTNPTGGETDWQAIDAPDDTNFGAVTCPRVDFCVAVGQEGNIVTSTDPTGGAGAWRTVGAPVGQSALQAIGCASTALCIAGNKSGTLLTSTDPRGDIGTWRSFNGGGSVQVTSATCPSASECLVVDNNGSVATSTNPTGGPSAWNYSNLIRYELPQDGSFQEGNGLFGAACVSRSFCALTGARGQIFTSTDPFAEPTAPVKKKSSKRGAKRPKAKIATLRLFTKSVQVTHAKALARFFARGGNSGFICKIDTARYRRCHSPKRFHLDRGRHVFRVRAIGVTGKEGPAASAVIFVGVCRKEGHRKRCGSYVEK
jgi:hypothetical protein